MTLNEKSHLCARKLSNFSSWNDREHNYQNIILMIVLKEKVYICWMSFPSWVSACLKSKDLLFFNQLDAKHLDVSAKSDPLVSFRRKPGFYIQSVVCFRRHMKLFQRITSSITSALHLSLVIFKQDQTEMGVPPICLKHLCNWVKGQFSELWYGLCFYQY